jgi:hypothetical protein
MPSTWKVGFTTSSAGAFTGCDCGIETEFPSSSSSAVEIPSNA